MVYDVAIIGGGPAGLMAAGQAGARGAHVLVIEKNVCLGKKLLLTGHGRCNLTNTQADDKHLMGVYGINAKFLFSAFSKFGVEATRNFFADLGVVTKVEDNGRVFPESNRSNDVLKALNKNLKEHKVEILLDTEVAKIIVDSKKVKKIVLKNNQEILAKNFILATGGKSYPQTGSSGEAYAWLSKIGHKINQPRPALTSVTVKEKLVKKLEGLSMQNIGISLFCQGKKVVDRSGEILFTANGLSGPAILDLSSRIGSLLPSPIIIEIDFQPDVSLSELEKNIQTDFHNCNNKIIKNYLTKLAPPKLLPVILKLSGIAEQKQVNSITKPERQALVKALKKFNLEIIGLKDFDKAMITAGGVEVKEIDPKTMRSRLFSNLYIIGELLDLDGPSGGYNLQIAWSTGYSAGDSVEF